MINQPSFFLWPRGRLKVLSLPTTATKVEAQLSSMFVNAFPVLVSSGRAGLSLILKGMELKRSNMIELFPYASHCVLEAVARIATPSTNQQTSDIRIIYHQWGYVQNQAVGPNDIEDSVDTLCKPGAKLLVAEGRFEVWSLPKIIGTLGGGVIWCQNLGDANKLRGLRDSSKGIPSLQWLLRWIGEKNPATLNYWAGAETNCSRLPSFAAGNVLSVLSTWEEIAKDRQSKLDILAEFLPSWLPRHSDRLPSVVCIEINNKELIAQLEQLGVQTGMRHFERIYPDGTRKLVQVLPLPIHQDVPMEIIHAMSNTLNAYY